ncbi:MAG: tRNA 2-thiocytidine(32) synthetase TtcA [Sutterellaceae bacterium]|nr:tRNA 2-thiocytidine(32) synthetase TtcA [Sutterellaceae bacterium]MDD7442416.1 tRNA 2-thiocytidine(32) synthetase TtcA [Sutterellaceae bacterium]
MTSIPPIRIIPVSGDPEELAAAPQASGENPAGKRKKSVSQKKLEKRIVRLVGKAIGDFRMIEEGDRIGVAVSGGKDSYVLLDALLQLQRRAPVHFDVIAVNIDMNLPGFPHDLLPDYFRSIGVPFHIERQDAYATIKRIIPSGEHICSLCSRLRRGILYSTADRLGLTKIALGHQMDDMVSTLLLNMFYSGQLKSMPPVLRSDDGKHVVIRPLAYVHESDTRKLAKLRGYPLVPKNLCGFAENRCRHEIKMMMAEWARKDPERMHNIFKSMTKVAPSHLLDRSLWDFHDFKSISQPPRPLNPRKCESQRLSPAGSPEDY